MKKNHLPLLSILAAFASLTACAPFSLTSGLTKDEIKDHINEKMTTDKILDTSTYTMTGTFIFHGRSGEHVVSDKQLVRSPDYRKNLNAKYVVDPNAESEEDDKFQPTRVGFFYYAAPSMFLRVPVYLGKDIMEFKSPIYDENTTITDGWYRQMNEKMVSQTKDSIAKMHTEVNDLGGITFTTTKSNLKILLWYVDPYFDDEDAYAISRWDMKFVYDANGLLVSEYITTTAKQKGDRKIELSSTYQYQDLAI